MAWSVPGYHEIHELGRGASGRVVLAEHQETGTQVAIKYLAPDLVNHPEFTSAFRSEAQILSEVRDERIVRLYEYVEQPEGAAIVMELVNGVSLRQIIKAHGPTEPQTALFVLKGSLLGLAAAHRLGIVHRDYKPSNVLVNVSGESKLSDFGIATRTGHLGRFAGTPPYMAPEQWANAPASPSTDIYAATVTFFECVVGTPPYRGRGGDLDALRSQHEFALIPIEAVPEQVRGLVQSGLAKHADNRPEDAATFLAELERVAGAGYGPDWEEEGRSALARRAALLVSLFPLAGVAAGGMAITKSILGWWRRSWRPIAAGGALIVALSGGTAYVLSRDNSAPQLMAQPTPPVAPTDGPTPNSGPTPSGTPTQSPTASPTQSPTASPTRSPSASLPVSPTPAPKPASGVTSFLAPVPGHPDDFCWYGQEGGPCLNSPPLEGVLGAHARVTITVTTMTGAPVALHLRLVQVHTDQKTGQQVEDVGPQDAAPIIMDVSMAAGYTTRTIQVAGIDLGSFWLNNCRYHDDSPMIKLTITSDNGGPASAPVYIQDNQCQNIG